MRNSYRILVCACRLVGIRAYSFCEVVLPLRFLCSLHANAGDSGNDVLMLEGDHPAIVVGNAQPELIQWVLRQPQDGKVVYSLASYADGILEGLYRHSLY